MVLLAISFGAPSLFGWFALAGVPILIHLLHRQRHRIIDWGAMRWLLAAVKKNQRWIQVEQWLLLALRTLLIALTVLAMSKPALDQAQGFFTVLGPSTHHILVIDNSLSMQFGDGNANRLVRAKEIASSILDEARQGDLASAIILGSPTQVLVGEASPYLVSVAQEIEGVSADDGTARIESATEPLAQILRASPASRRRVYLVTDMQRSTWLGDVDGVEPAELRQRLIDLAEQAEFVVLDVSGAESPNVAVTEIKPTDPAAIIGRPVAIRAALTNFGRVDKDDTRVELLVDGEVEASETASIPSGETKYVSFAPKLESAGDHAIEVRLAHDSLPTDDSRNLVARVRDRINVLVIDGEPSGEPFRSETDYLRVALAPTGDEARDGLIQVTVRPESDLLERSLDTWDQVVVANVAQFTEPEVKALAEFVRRGGGLAIFLGSQSNPDNLQRVLFAEETGLLPVQLEGFVGDAKPNDAGHTFDPKDYAHPLVADFRDQEQAGLVTTRIYRYAKVTLPAQTSVEVPLAYETGDPAIVLSHMGAGTVALVTTSADLDWNTWAISPSFVPIVQQLTQNLIAGRTRRDEVRVGEPINLFLPESVGDVSATVTSPPRKASAPVPAETIRPARVGGLSSLSFAETQRSGIYSFRVGPPVDETWLAPVNTIPAESNLAKITEDDLRGSLAGWEFRLLDRWESTETVGTTAPSAGGSIHRGLLMAALAIALIEPLLARRFGHYKEHASSRRWWRFWPQAKLT